MIQRMMRRESGFSLLELLLVIVVMGLLMAGAFQIFNDWVEKSTNRTVVRQMLLVQNAAEEYVSANFATLLPTIPNLAEATNLDLDTLRDSGFLPQAFPDATIFRQPIDVILINGGVGLKGEIIQVLTITGDSAGDTRVVESRLLDAALAGGPSVGVYTARTGGEIRSAYAEWAIAQNDIQAVYDPIPPDQQNGGYIASYGQASIDDLAQSDYLYRVPMFDSAGNQLFQLNQMATDLDMGGNEIQSAAAFSVDQMRVNGAMNVEGENITTAGFNPYALSVDEVLQVSGNASRIGYAFSENSDPNCRFVDIAGETRVDDALVPPSGICEVVGGEMTVHGDTDDLTVDIISQSMNVDGPAIAGIANVQNTPTFGDAQFDFVNANEVTAGRAVADDLFMSNPGSIVTQELRSGVSAQFNSVDLTSGSLVAGDLEMSPNANVVVDRDMIVERSFETYGNYWSSGTFNAVRSIEMDSCEQHGDCFDPNLIVNPSP